MNHFSDYREMHAPNAHSNACSAICPSYVTTPKYDLHLSYITLIEVSSHHKMARPSYSRVGDFRTHPGLSSIPIMALTATASAKVRHDITSLLHFSKDPFLASNTIDRDNLRISVVASRSTQSGHNLQFLAQRLCAQGRSAGSTIVYVPTTGMVETVVHYLREELAAHTTRGGPAGTSGAEVRTRQLLPPIIFNHV